jgi:hypothetical protein
MAAELLARGQIQGDVAQRAEIALGEGQVAAAQAAPMALGGAALEQEANPEQSTEPDPTAMLQMEQELTQQHHEASEASKDRAHEMALLDKEGKRDKEVAQHDATQKIRIEKAKPKPVKSAGKGAKK